MCKLLPGRDIDCNGEALGMTVIISHTKKATGNLAAGESAGPDSSVQTNKVFSFPRALMLRPPTAQKEGAKHQTQRVDDDLRYRPGFELRLAEIGSSPSRTSVQSITWSCSLFQDWDNPLFHSASLLEERPCKAPFSAS